MKRFFCILLAVLMLACAVPAFAAEASPFSDVKTSRWSYKAIKYAYEMKYMDGIGGGKFGPAGTMTRAMVATVLYRKAGSPAVSFSNDFSDVSSGKWYSNAVIWAKSNGIVEGYSDGTFRPSGEITREQLAAMFFRFAGTVGYDTRIKGDLSAFPDASKTHSYAKNALTWATARGFITGVKSGKVDLLDPRGNATREQFATIIKRFDDAGPNYALEYAEPQIISSYTSPEYPLVTDADFYVSPDGDDNASGTDVSHPFASFERARDAVRELKTTKTSGDIVVAFKAGDYGALDNVTFTSGDSGREDQRIIYRAYGDGDVVFNNGIRISVDSFVPITDEESKLFPEGTEGKILKARFAGFEDGFRESNVVFCETGACVEARFPNTDAKGADVYYTDMTTTVDEYHSIRVIGPLAAKIASFRSTEGLYVTGFLRTGWFPDTFPVKSYDKDSSVITFDFENYDFTGHYSLDEYPLAYEDRMDDKIYFHGLPEFLDKKGEFWIDKKTNTLFVYEPSGDFMVTSGGTALTLEAGADNISFIGLSILGTADSAVICDGNGVTFDRCRIGYVSGKAALLCTYVSDLTVTGCEFFGFVCGGVNVHSASDVDKNIFALQNDGIVIDNNYFHDFGLPSYFDEAAAVVLKRNVGTVISHNEFRDGAHGAVLYAQCVDTLIEHNVFDKMMKTTQDFGAVYTFCDVTFRDNVIRYNVFMNEYNEGGQHGIYLDGSYGQIIYSNLFYNCGTFNIMNNNGRDNDIHDNIAVGDPSECFLLYNKGAYDSYERGEDVTETEWYHYLVNDWNRPGEDSPWYEKWYERWPVLYLYTTDPESVGDYYSFFTITNKIKNNKVFGMQYIGGLGVFLYDQFADKENNETFAMDENPFFVDPTFGDYRIREDSGFPDIYFEQAGRY